MRVLDATALSTPAEVAGVSLVATERVTVRPLAIAAMWSLQADVRRGSLTTALLHITGEPAPPAPHRMSRTPCGAWAAWTGPGSVLLIAGADAVLPPTDETQAQLRGTGAAVFDVGDSRHAVVLEGQQGGVLLSGGCPADISEAAFPAGAVRSSLLGPLPCIIARPSAAALWWVMVPRSYGTSLRDWLRGPWIDFDLVEAEGPVSP